MLMDLIERSQSMVWRATVKLGARPLREEAHSPALSREVRNSGNGDPVNGLMQRKSSLDCHDQCNRAAQR